MKKILVPVDFSKYSMMAALYAAEISQRSGAVIHLLHALGQRRGKFIQPFSQDHKYDNVLIDNRKADLQTFRLQVQQSYPTVACKILLHGKDTIVDSILKVARKEQFDIVVMGTHGRNAVTSTLFGSVTAAVVNRCNIPVLAIPERYQLDQPRSIVFATNHFEENMEILDKLVELTKLFTAKLYVVSFINTDEAEPADFKKVIKDLLYYCDFLKDKYPGLDVECDLLEGSSFESCIKQYNASRDIDVVAMIPYPKTALEKMLRRSSTRSMCLHSSIPVLSIPAV